MTQIEQCRPVITDDEMPQGDGSRVFIYEDGTGTAWFLVNRAALHADPEGVFCELVENCDGLAGAYERVLRLSA